MIVVTLMGGLGNQMFQYAAGKSLSMRSGQALWLDNSFLESKHDPSKVTPREYSLDVFSLKEKPAAYQPMLGFGKPWPYRFNRLIEPFARRVRSRSIFDDTTPISAFFSPLKKNVLLQGYFQSEAYFKDHREALRSAFQFPVLRDVRNTMVAEEIRSSRSVSVHVRRGDYVSNPSAAAYHGTCSPAYYHQAMEIMKSREQDLKFFVFSDDIAWCEVNFGTSPNIHYVANNNDASSYVDMQLMSMCRHHIIANSSFSWWGAWLNPSNEEMVIAPKGWFSDPNKNTQRIYPEGWMAL